MTRARREQINAEETPFVGCVSRVVRRSYLFGDDPLTGRNYGHRKQWIVDKLTELPTIFAIDVCAYAILSNHWHGVVKIDAERARSWDEDEVIERWHRLFSGDVLAQRHVKGDALTEAERQVLSQKAAVWRERLYDVSWFMRCVNEHVARAANKEDGCTGRFWEGRFKSQALLDERAVLACMVYVDLNPIRAGLCETPEASDFTSIQARIRAYSDSHAEGASSSTTQPVEPPNAAVDAADRSVADSVPSASPSDDRRAEAVPLLPFLGGERTQHPTAGIPFALTDYLQLVDWTGRAVRADKHGYIPADTPPILKRLGLEPERWVDTIVHYDKRFHLFVGPAEALRALARRLGSLSVRGITASRLLFGV